MNISSETLVYIFNPTILGIWSVIFLLRTWWTSNRKCRTSTGIIKWWTSNKKVQVLLRLEEFITMFAFMNKLMKKLTGIVTVGARFFLPMCTKATTRIGQFLSSISNTSFNSLILNIFLSSNKLHEFQFRRWLYTETNC